MQKKVTISQIADQANVSSTTVLNVLNGKKNKMKKETYEKIQAIIDDSGYVRTIAPTLLAQTEKRLFVVMIDEKLTKTICPNEILLFLAELEKTMFLSRYYLLFHIYNTDNEIITYAKTWQARGVFVCGQIINDMEPNLPIKVIDVNRLKEYKGIDFYQMISAFFEEMLALSRKCDKI